MGGAITDWGKTSSTTIVGSTEQAYEGSHSLKVVGDGSAVAVVRTTTTFPTLGASNPFAQQIKVKGTAGVVLNFALLQVNGTTISQTSKTLTGNWDTITLTGTTLSTTTTVYMQIWTASAIVTTFYIDQTMLETGSVVHRWIPGQTSANTVTVENSTNYNQTIRAGGFVAVPTNATLIDLQSRGLTDCFYSDGKFLTDYATFKTNVQNFLTNMQGTNLKLHVIVPPFTNPDGSVADPTSTTYQNEFSAQIAQLFTDCPSLTGFSLDDYMYPDSVWTTKKIGGESETQLEMDLQNFADIVRVAVHNAKSAAIFSINVYPVASHSSSVAVVASHCDIIMSEIYRMGWVPDGTDSHTWVKSTLESNIIDAGTTPLICDIITTNTKDSAYTTADIIKDVNIALNHNIAGYMLWQWGYCPSDLYWPNNIPYQGSHSICVATGGYNAGEGVNIPISAITANNSQYAISLRIKAPLNVGLTLKLGAGATKSITGTGDWQTVSDIQIPTDQKIYLVTSSATATTFYVDILDETITVNQTPTPPTVTLVDPTNNEVNVAINKAIKVTFSESIKAGTGWIELVTSDGTIIPIKWSINGNTLTITPNNALGHGVKYTLLVHTGSVTD
ncbi:MAG: Ig-like domain-containing protein, partial [Methanobacterium paludis]|nr:Ig-like domain-containing protein [Methanobacterium paludis]